MSKNNAIRKMGRALTAALLLIVIVSTMLITTSCSKKTDYLKSNLDKYIEFPENYKNFDLNVDIAKARDIDIDVTILNMLCEDKSETPLYNGNAVTSAITITPGDIVHIWYRGYIFDENGQPVEVDGMSNFSGSSAYELEIGSNSLLPGFELSLVGVDTKGYSKFNKITSGAITENHVAYVSYTRIEGTNKITATSERIDLSGDVDAKYGEGFKDKLLKTPIAAKTDSSTTINGKTYSYSDLKIDFVTNCESNPIIVDAYFPYDYQKTELRNESARFEVYVEKAVLYDTPEFNDEYIKEKIEKKEINLTLDELNTYEGANLVEKYRAFAKKTMEDIYESEYNALVVSGVWEYFNQNVKIKEFPADKVEEKYKEYHSRLEQQFNNSNGQVYNQYTGQYDTYNSLDKYAIAYFGLSSDINYKNYLIAQAQSYVKERLILYYIFREEKLQPSKSDLNSLINAMREEYVADYVAEYLSYEGKTKDDYTEEEYAEFVEVRRGEILSYYNEDYFSEQVYFRLVDKEIVKWPNVITLDERRAYPFAQDK